MVTFADLFGGGGGAAMGAKAAGCTTLKMAEAILRTVIEAIQD